MKLKDTVFCALDLETTGPNYALDRIVEVGLIQFTLDGVMKTFDTLVNPDMEIPQFIISIHGITNEMVKDAPRIGDLLKNIADFVGQSPLVIQNPQFDLGILESEFRRYDQRIPRLIAYDTVRLSRMTFTEMTNHKLNTLCENLNIKLEHHRALSDAFGCMEVFKKIIKHHDQSNMWDFRDFKKLHGKGVKPKSHKK